MCNIFNTFFKKVKSEVKKVENIERVDKCVDIDEVRSARLSYMTTHENKISTPQSKSKPISRSTKTPHMSTVTGKDWLD